MATQPLFFAEISENAGAHARLLIQRYVRENLPGAENPLLAVADLNGDNMSEYIVRTGACEKDKGKFCTFHLLGKKNNDLVVLSQIQARTIILGNAYTANIRNIIAYSNPQNDFERAIYTWSPERATYIIANQD